MSYRIKERSLRDAFIALDGEGYRLEDGTSLYFLLAASDGSKVVRPEGLSTRYCLLYLLQLKRDHPKAIFVGFGLNYDINLWLKDLEPDALQELWSEGQTFIKDEEGLYRLEWLPHKWFNLTFRRWGSKDKTSIRIYDTYGFFQCPFMQALLEWGILTPQDPDFVFMDRMKSLRSSFATESDLKTIERYNFLECQYLVRLMEKLRQAASTCGLKPRGWQGNGALARSMLELCQAEEVIAPQPAEIEDLALKAYYGARIQVFKIGELGENVPIYAYDIRSAYPYALAQLPDLAHGHWQAVRSYQPGAIGVYLVQWHVPADAPAPFPFRVESKEGRQILWTELGAGWYWSPEVESALAFWGSPEVEIGQGYVFIPDRPDSRPFKAIYDWYNQRKAYRLAGHPAQYVLKGGLNAMYGKLAQGLYRGKFPRLHSYIYAGLITSATRAKIYRAIMQDPLAVIFIATDGIVTSRPLDVELGEELGQWSLRMGRDLFIIQPGLYEWADLSEPDSQGRIRLTRRHRGFKASEIDFDALRQEWRRRGPYMRVRVPCSRFIGLGQALQREDLSLWGKWLEGESMTKEIKAWNWFYVAPPGEDGMCRTYDEYYPDTLSAPYRPRGSDREYELMRQGEEALDEDQPDLLY